LNGGRVTAPDDPGRAPVEFTSSDSRFHPRTGAFELAGGQGQYGLTFDDYGRRFICANRHPVWHVVLEPRHLQRNAHLAFSDTVQEVSTVGAEARVWPLSRDLTTASFMPTLLHAPHSGTFTAASGVHVHRGTGLPEGHRDSLFITESAQNLVQRQVRVPRGVSFASKPARDGVEFLASRDTWFRPVFATAGPDGALYIVDMYRKDIDHPAYVPEASRSSFDFRAGTTRGRIYRAAAAHRAPVGVAVPFAAASSAALVPYLAHADGWWRDAAQRRLIEREARDVAPALRALAAGDIALGRLHALWTMAALDVLGDDDVVRALRDDDPGVRENAARLAEPRVARSQPVLDAVLAAARDDVQRVRLHAALALGASDDARALQALAAIARRDGTDRWMRAAVLSSVGQRVGAFLAAFVNDAAMAVDVRAAVMQDLAQLFGAGQPLERCLALVTEIVDPRAELRWQPAALSGLAAGLRARRTAPADRSPLLALVGGEGPQARLARERLMTQMARAAALATIDGTPPEQRLPAIELLGHGDWASSGATLLALLEPHRPGVLQIAAVRALGQLRDTRAATHLLHAARWQAYTPRVREAVLTTVLADERLVPVLLDAVERRQVPALALGSANWRRLTTHRHEAIRTRAAALFTSAGARTAMQVYERVRDGVLARRGDPRRGAEAFATFCAACHSFAGAGGRVGPDLSGIGNQPADAILLHIVVPDYEITPGFESYRVQTRDGRAVVGRLESEAPNSVTIRDGAGAAQTLLRRDVESITAGDASLMPAGLGQAMPAAQLADLIAYLKRQP
jgi:putative heme-binding domain-containing protein